MSDVDQFNLDAEKYNKMLEEKAKKTQLKKTTKPVIKPVTKPESTEPIIPKPKPVVPKPSAPTSNSSKPNNFKNIINNLVELEGGKSNLSYDKGGKTNLGITQYTYNNWNKKHNKPLKDVYKITRQEADQIYKEEYWNIIKGDQLPPNVAHIMLSQALLDGPQDSIRLVQKLLGLKVDGIMGSDTINKIKRLTVNGDIKLATAIANKQIYRLKTDEDADKFGKGWNSRVRKVMKKFKGK
jgi:lysozyme family protein